MTVENRDSRETVRVVVRCTLEVVVEMPVDWDDHDIKFRLEENGCPGTGSVGMVIDEAMEHGEAASVCWACNLKGTNEVLRIERPDPREGAP